MVKEDWSYQFTKCIWHHKPQNLIEKKCVLLDFQLLNCLVSWFELYLCLPVFKWVSKIKSEFSNVASTDYVVSQQLTGFPCWGIPPTSQKFAHSLTWKNSSQETSSPPPPPPPPSPPNFYSLPPPKANFPN